MSHKDALAVKGTGVDKWMVVVVEQEVLEVQAAVVGKKIPL